MMDNLRYVAHLLRSLDWALPRPGRHTTLGLLLVAVLVGTAAVHGSEAGLQHREGGLAQLNERARQTIAALQRVEDLYEAEVAPLERVLHSYRSDDPQLIRQVAVSLVREAKRTDLEPQLLLAVLLVENPWINPDISSPVGAQGLMQVMPLHRGNWKPCPPRLDDVEANICHGASIFASYLKSERGNVDRALLRYNGCVRGTNTPNCQSYPNHVYARAGRATLMAAAR